ncbi:MAG: sulfatase [Planctomycetota bacterium]
MKGKQVSRRIFLRFLSAGATGLLIPALLRADKSRRKRPNVLFIAVDDLNDWVGCFGGHPQAITPHMDRLAETRGMVFSRAYCPSTVCCPSRSALLTGILPSDSGVYGNSQNLKNAQATKNAITLPQYFSKHGYFTLSRGKIFHKHMTEKGLDEGQWAFDKWVPTKTEGSRSPDTSNGPANKLPMLDGSKAAGKAKAFDWGPTSGKDEGTKDYQTALWAAQELSNQFDKPFFMAIGLSKPHLPWYVPKKYFDMYPLDKVEVPEFRLDDLDDIKLSNGKNKFNPSEDFLRVKKYGRFKEATQAYLAAVSYADDCIGVILNALEKSRYAGNTIVVIWGDHGWFLGEKLKYRKTHLWEESARCPLIIKAPGLTSAGRKCHRVVNLIDLYPTLIDLCGLPRKSDIAGRSIKKLLARPDAKWDYPALTTYQKGNHTIRSERWRYTKYADGVEELYDHQNDPMEWKNLAGNPKYGYVKAELVKWIPKYNADDSPRNKIEKKSGQTKQDKQAQRRAKRLSEKAGK